jgi:hypothetical protein
MLAAESLSMAATALLVANLLIAVLNSRLVVTGHVVLSRVSCTVNS